MPEFKKDRYLRARGGKAFFVEIFCGKCGTKLLLYQKDGDGQLKRCYLNRIFWPPELENLQRDPLMQEPKNVPPLACSNCKIVIGMAIHHHSGRIAFRLRPGYFSKKRITS